MNDVAVLFVIIIIIVFTVDLRGEKEGPFQKTTRKAELLKYTETRILFLLPVY